MRQSKELKVAIAAAKAAGKVVMKYYENVHYVRLKSPALGIVTEADLQSQKKIKKVILKAFPKAEFYAEEDKVHRARDEAWLVDPIDGTQNFYRGFPLFAVSIGLVRKRKPVLGVIYLPITKELFYAEKGKGAFLNGKRIHVSKISKLQEAMFDLAVSNRASLRKKHHRDFERILSIMGETRVSGSAAIRLAYIAAGRIDAYVEFGMWPWDWAAGAILVLEAGGKVTNFQGKTFQIYKDREIVASNGKFHKKIIEVLK
jgi:myo-inositol-1(or 4)-monophosphatase